MFQIPTNAGKGMADPPSRRNSFGAATKVGMGPLNSPLCVLVAVFLRTPAAQSHGLANEPWQTIYIAAFGYTAGRAGRACTDSDHSALDLDTVHAAQWALFEEGFACVGFAWLWLGRQVRH